MTTKYDDIFAKIIPEVLKSTEDNKERQDIFENLLVKCREQVNKCKSADLLPKYIQKMTKCAEKLKNRTLIRLSKKINLIYEPEHIDNVGDLVPEWIHIYFDKYFEISAHYGGRNDDYKVVWFIIYNDTSKYDNYETCLMDSDDEEYDQTNDEIYELLKDKIKISKDDLIEYIYSIIENDFVI